MKICSFCGERNEDWMDICQRCGNSIKNADYKNDEEDDITFQTDNRKYSSKRNNKVIKTEIKEKEVVKENKEKLVIENIDLKIILAVLVFILIILIIYTLSTFI